MKRAGDSSGAATHAPRATDLAGGALNSRSARPYLVALAAGVLYSGYLQYLYQYEWPDLPTIKSQPVGIWSAGLFFLVSLALWLPAKRSERTSGLLVTFLLALGLLWTLVMVLSGVHGDLFTHAAWLYPVALLMVAVKPPDWSEARSVLTFVGWNVAAIIVLTRVAELLGLLSMPDIGTELVAFEKANYWLPLSGTIGPEGRWPGPFGHNAMTGNMGALLVILGLGLRTRFVWVLAPIGVVVLLLTNSRSSWVAAGLGAVIVLVFGSQYLAQKVGRGRLLGLGIIAASIVAVLAYRASPTLTGRTTTYWPEFLGLWQSSPWIGVGNTGKSELLPANLDNGHNILIDVLAKYGLAAGTLVVVALAVAVVLAAKASLIGRPISLGLVVALITIGITQSDHGWNEMSPTWLFLVLATLAANAARTGSDLPTHLSPSGARKD